MDLFLLHCLVLAWSSAGCARQLARTGLHRGLVAALLLVGNLGVTRLLLGWLHHAADLEWYFALSVLLVVATMLITALRHATRQTQSRPLAARRWVWAALTLVLAPSAVQGWSSALGLARGDAGIALPSPASAPLVSPAEAPPVAPGPGSLFVSELVGPYPSIVAFSDGLQPVEGPYPDWHLPRIRWACQPSTRLVIPPTPRLSRVEFAYSVRLQVRPRGALEVVWNGRVVEICQLEGRACWFDRHLTLVAQPGENVLELRDFPLREAPDWLEYLRHYPDVRDFLIAHNIPLEQGALTHFESNGRAEGRVMHMMEVPIPAPDSHFFMFRRLRLEGYRSP